MPRPTRDWAAQHTWLEQAYPPMLHWYNQASWDIFEPGLLRGLYRLMADIETIQWSAYRQDTLLGVLACQKTMGRADALWAAFPERPDANALTMLLLHARRMLAQTRGLSLEYPAGVADDAIRAAGFQPQRTLVWMEAQGATF